MAGAQQYNFPPPPPPPGPPPAGYPQQNSQFGYQRQPPQSNEYSPHNPAPYIGPQAGPRPTGPPNNYAPQQWQQHGQHGQHNQHGQHGPPQHNQHGPHTQHGPPQHNHGPQPVHQQPAPVPLPAQNYHPNYAPQSYNQQPQYGPQQPPPFQQHPYGPPAQQPHQGPPQQWQGPPQYNNARGRGRGGFNNGRGGHEAPLMGPPIRMGFDNERGEHMAQAGNGFPPQFPNHSSPPAPFSQPSYQGYPPQNFPHGGQRPPLDSHQFNSNPNRGRGNGNFRGRGRDNFQFRGRDNNRSQFSNNSHSPHQMHSRPAGAGDHAKKNKKKRRTNTLGLTPNGVDHEDSDDEIDDVDEEARLVTLLGPDTPQLPTDLDAWLAERKARFPTKARREAAAEEARLRREQGQNNKPKKDAEGKSGKKEEGESKLERQQRKAEKLRLELEKAERKIQDAMSGGKRKRENGDEGDEDRGQVSDDDSDSSKSDSENSKPDAMSSRNNGSHRLPPPPKAQLQRHCKYFSTGGTCGKKGKCRFVHDQEVRNQALREKELNGGKMTIAQRLILNDTAKDDLTILKSIKYLKEKGLMPDTSSASAPPAEDENQFKSEENEYADV
ncbi:hypothetical protein ACMFMG_008255 [Clarireedia jacksonii]